MFSTGVAVDRLVGFEQLGGIDGFKTEQLENKLIAAGVLDALRPKTGTMDGEARCLIYLECVADMSNLMQLSFAYAGALCGKDLHCKNNSQRTMRTQTLINVQYI